MERITIDKNKVSRCLLCENAKCTQSCPYKIDCASVIRSLYFENYNNAFNKLNNHSCKNCDAPCERECVLSKKSSPVLIREILTDLYSSKDSFEKEKLDKVDISTDICGKKLLNPFMLSSSVVASNYEMCARAFDYGWAGVCFKTIPTFEQREASPRFSSLKDQSGRVIGFKNIEQLSEKSIEENMKIFRDLKKNYPNRIIISSIMCKNEKEWTELSAKCEDNGADVIECNFSCPNMEDGSVGITIGQDKDLVEKYTRATKKGTSLPVLVKPTPNVADMTPFALAAKQGGADGISLINTLNCITGVDLDTLVAEPNVASHSMIGGYSGKAVKPIGLRFLTELYQNKQLSSLHFSAMGGIETYSDALEYISLGASSIQITTAVMLYGVRIIEDLLQGVEHYLKVKGIKSIKSLVGAASSSVVSKDHIERGTIYFPIHNKDKCISCGRCYISCRDGGHQAITFDGMPHFDGKKCVGCQLCGLVCPEGAITKATKGVVR